MHLWVCMCEALSMCPYVCGCDRVYTAKMWWNNNGGFYIHPILVGWLADKLLCLCPTLQHNSKTKPVAPPVGKPQGHRNGSKCFLVSRLNSTHKWPRVPKGAVWSQTPLQVMADMVWEIPPRNKTEKPGRWFSITLLICFLWVKWFPLNQQKESKI